MRRLRRRPPRALVVDVFLAAALLFVMAVGTSHVGQVPPRRAPDALADALMVAIAGAMALRRFHPLPVLAVTLAATSAYFLVGYPYGPVLFASSLALFTVGRELPARRGLAAAGLAIAVLVAVQLVGLPGAQVSLQAAHLAAWQSWLLLPWAPAGAALRARRGALQRQREDEAASVAYEERLRVAREVHDVVGHGLAVINMQAGIALHLLERRPERSREALEAIKQTSKDSLEELRRTLAVFRRPDGAATRHPAPGLGQLGAMASAMKESGVPVEVKISGARRELPAMVDLTAYRIVQESLTNVLRHAGPTTATVQVTYEPRQVLVEVADRGRARPGGQAPGGGHGLAGMRERVAAVGGTLEAGPRAAGGFRVLARLPLGEVGA
jgi:signal transduction histidine kinase